MGKDDYYLISAATGKNVDVLCHDIMDFIEENPRQEQEKIDAQEVKLNGMTIIKNNCPNRSLQKMTKKRMIGTIGRKTMRKV